MTPALTPQRISRKVRALPSMSTAVRQLTALVNDARACAADFERVIRKDAGLATRLLKLANSAAFGLRGRVSSIEHAAALLGHSRMLDLAMSASFSKLIPEVVPAYGMSSEQFWRHTAACALLAERFAGRAAVTLASEAFTAGLLHDCGKLVIGSFFDKGSEVFLNLEDDQELSQHERDLLGMDHSQVGQIVIDSWGLPPVLGEAARYHHCPDETEDETARGLVRVVAAANVAAHLLEERTPDEQGNQPPPSEICPLRGEDLALLRFSMEEVYSLIEEVRPEVEDMASQGS